MTGATRTKSAKIIDRVDDAAAAFADGDDKALDILNGVLDDYGEDDD